MFSMTREREGELSCSIGVLCISNNSGSAFRYVSRLLEKSPGLFYGRATSWTSSSIWKLTGLGMKYFCMTGDSF